MLNMHSLVEMIQSSNYDYNQLIMLTWMDSRNSVSMRMALDRPSSPVVWHNHITPRGS
jgi:hypothetical protein